MTIKTPLDRASEKALKKKIALQRGQRIRLARSLATLSRNDLCEKYKINKHTIHAWEKGINCLNEKQALKLLEAFHQEGLSITKEWLLYGDANLEDGLKNDPRNIKDMLDVCGELNFLKEINFFKNNNMNAISTMVSDEALSPIFCQGDYVGGIKLLGANIKSLIGEFCIVTTKDNHLVTRKLFRHERDNFYTIGSVNPYVNLEGPDYHSCAIQSAAKITRHWYLDRVQKGRAIEKISI